MPAKKRTLPYGTWPSPITAAVAARASRRLGMLQADGDLLYWTESRPEEQGRQVIVRAGPGSSSEDILPPPYSARSRVHEYGGGELLVAGGLVYFVNDKDQQVYTLAPGQQPERLTAAARTRFADLTPDPVRERLVGVAEVHTKGSDGEHAPPRNVLVGIALGSKRGKLTELAAGRDFYASARLSPDGRQLAFLAWDLPDMPWDSAALYVASVRDDGSLGRPNRIAGGHGSATFQPEWGPDGQLYFAWDETGWGCLYRWDGERTALVLKAPRAELWRSQWVFGMRCYAFGADGRLAAVLIEDGQPVLELGSVVGRKLVTERAAQKDAARIDDPVAVGNTFAAIVGPALAAPAVMRLQRGQLRPVVPAPPPPVEPGYLSRGEVCELRNARRERVLGVYYAPRNAGHQGPKGTLPPALVLAHGGPTSMTDASLKMRVQYYTSRGFAVLDVNYGGSTGFGRAYRERLDGQWGIVDVADCAAAARHLGRQGLAAPDKIAIAGGSAGGYTTLMALATTNAFAAGCSHYGVSDLGLLMEHTHKFESGYLHRLLGTRPGRWKTVCAERSPLNLIDGIRAPVILFQGLDDKVVPPEQSRLIRDKLQARGVEVEYHEFRGEAHGFRKAETIIAVLEAELAFLRRVMLVG
ncbi:MAG TPA: prolyl oligopeptidase family serine peptidase [Hyphomicrobiaceae bacterium]|nr:prolyl oligopeptidase family serine peptidase [Hyphomicrobiaceae bacterium]